MILLRRLLNLCRRRKLDAEMAEEMRLHLEMQTERNRATGMTPDDARYAASRQFGNLAAMQEQVRDQRGWLGLEHFFRDLRHAGRSLVNAPGFSFVAVVTLALAIGVNAAVFALVNAAVLRPVVPLRPDEVVNLFNGRQAAERDFRLFSHEEYLALRAAKGTFADVAATLVTSAGIAGDDGIRRGRTFFASENYFAMLGVQPALGRFFTAEECRPNANIPVVVASHAFWQREGGRADFVGRILRVNGNPYTVIGVAAEGFHGVSAFMAADLWAPLGAMSRFGGATGSDLALPKSYQLNLTARLAPGITRESLAPHLAALGRHLTELQSDSSAGARELHAETPSRYNVSSSPAGNDPAVPVTIGLFSMSAGVLLIACLNLANMFLARGASREKEIALRLALGADRGRIVRQLLTEGLLLAGVGGVFGLLAAMWGNTVLVQAFTSIVGESGGGTVALEVRPDARVIAATFLLGLVATLFFSLGPALKASRADLVSALKRDGCGATVGSLHGFFSLRHCLVMSQIALSLMLLFSSALFFRGALKAAQVPPGFDPGGTLVADLDYSITNLRADEAQQSLHAAIEHLGAQPGVQSVAVATFVPYSARSNGRSVQAASRAGSAASLNGTALYTAVTSGYFDAVGARLLRGRDFTAAEVRDPSAPRVVVIDEGLATKLFPNADALGQRVRLGANEAEVVGVCSPHRHSNRRPGFPDRVFVPYGSGHDGRAFLLVRYRTSDSAATAAGIAPLRTALRALDPDLPVLRIAALGQLVEQDASAWLARMGAIIFGLFGAIALLLAVIGVYGVKAYAVAQRTREIGIRMAIGGQRGEVMTLILKQGALQVLLAVAVGALMAVGAGKVLAKLLYQVSPTDPLALGVSVAVLGSAALCACYVPARRATKVNPLIALRSE